MPIPRIIVIETAMTELESKTLATTLYVSLFARAPDAGGLSYWTEQLQGGLSLRDAIGYFLDSNEGKSLHGTNISAPTFVDSLYQSVLNRTSDAGGSEFWQGRLSELGSRNEMVEQFITSIQGSGSTDHQLLQNRVEFGLSFAASKSGDNVSYAKSLLSSITSDPASLNIAKLVNASLDNPPAPTAPLPSIPGAAPVLALHEDTGASSADGITNNGTIDITLPLGAQSWEYSIDAGQNWVTGTGASFVLAEGIYKPEQVLARYADVSGTSSQSATLTGVLNIDKTGPSYVSNTYDFFDGLFIKFDEAVLPSDVKAVSFFYKNLPASEVFFSDGLVNGDLHYNAPVAILGQPFNLILPAGVVVDMAGNGSQAYSTQGTTFGEVP